MFTVSSFFFPLIVKVSPLMTSFALTRSGALAPPFSPETTFHVPWSRFRSAPLSSARAPGVSKVSDRPRAHEPGHVRRTLVLPFARGPRGRPAPPAPTADRSIRGAGPPSSPTPKRRPSRQHFADRRGALVHDADRPAEVRHVLLARVDAQGQAD